MFCRNIWRAQTSVDLSAFILEISDKPSNYKNCTDINVEYISSFWIYLYFVFENESVGIVSRSGSVFTPPILIYVDFARIIIGCCSIIMAIISLALLQRYFYNNCSPSFCRRSALTIICSLLITYKKKASNLSIKINKY